MLYPKRFHSPRLPPEINIRLFLITDNPTDNPIEITFDCEAEVTSQTLDIRIAQSREDKVIPLPPSPFNPRGYLSTRAQLTFPIVSFDFSNLENRSPRKKKEREREENRYKLEDW